MELGKGQLKTHKWRISLFQTTSVAQLRTWASHFRQEWGRQCYTEYYPNRPVIARSTYNKSHGQVENVDISDFSSNFYKSPEVKYRNMDFKNPEMSFLCLPVVKYENLDLRITWGIFQYVTYSGCATCFRVEFCTLQLGSSSE